MKRNILHETFKRKLIYFPIIHNQADMGRLSEFIRKATFRSLGREAWRRKEKLIEKIWADIERVIIELDLPYGHVRLYQDGLPVCGRETEIVNELAKTGSHNHMLLLRLMEKGATLMGTESPELIVEEYELFKTVLAVANEGKKIRLSPIQKELSDSLLKRRNRYIADRINETLLPGETGILFLGMLHDLKNLLAGDMQVVFPINRSLKGGGM